MVRTGVPLSGATEIRIIPRRKISILRKKNAERGQIRERGNGRPAKKEKKVRKINVRNHPSFY